jgi:hypothetical protein
VLRTAVSDAGDASVARMVPDRETAVVTLWFDDGQDPVVVRLRAGQKLVLGRGPDAGWPNQIELAQPGRRLISRNHLVVVHDQRRGWLLSHFPNVHNPGWYRYWGDLSWRDADVHDLHPRRGLLAYLFPGAPRYRLTLAGYEARPPEAPAGTRDRDGTDGTDDTTASLRIGVTPAQRTTLTDALSDAVLWPPSPDDGRVRTWAELGSGSDADRANYRRLKDRAEQESALRWTDPGRGADPLLLRKLVDTGEITYADVHDQRGEWPSGGLMPTHHTHQADGRRRNR